MRSTGHPTIAYKNIIAITVFILLFTAFCRFIEFPLIIPLLLLFCSSQIYIYRKADFGFFIRMSLLLSLIVFAAHAFKEYFDFTALYLPVASVSILTVLLYNDVQLAFFMALLSSILVSLVSGGSLNLVLIFFIGSLTGIYAVRDARTRGQLISAGIYVSLMQVVCAMIIFPEINYIFSKDFVLNTIRPLFMNGFIAVFTVGATLKLFEILFGVMTNYSLLELSDFNQPLLKRMILEAPGTYYHSMVVSNISEAAADAIGANSLLTRVGAYYHDIGKMEQSEYFTENQLVGGNKHDEIEPSISRLVILNHVKEGIELGRKNKLHQDIIDFIPQHHGTSLMHSFYQKALEEAEDHASIKEDNYRYPGPKPQRRETAIVLLADSVEAACRSLDEPTPKKIEEVVRKIINNKFIDGQLDECNLTLRDIETIAVTFTRILGAMYHTRVKYPEKKSNYEDRTQKQAKEILKDSRRINQDNQDHIDV